MARRKVINKPTVEETDIFLGASENNGDIQKYSVQFQYTGDGPMDTKQSPVETVDKLPSPLKAYEGQTVSVLNAEAFGDEKTIDYQFVGGVWVKKKAYIEEINGGTF